MSLVFSSGMAATSTALLTLLSAGDEVVCASAIYGGTFHFIEHLLPRFGVERRFVSLEELAAPAGIIGPEDQAGVVRVADQPDAALRRHSQR